MDKTTELIAKNVENVSFIRIGLNKPWVKWTAPAVVRSISESAWYLRLKICFFLIF